MKSIVNEKYKHETCLSSYVWNLKENGNNFKINWSIIERATTFSPVTQRCNLCLREKYHLIINTDLYKINSRNEFGCLCRHMRGKLIGNFKGII